MQSVSWNVRPSTSTGRCAHLRRALEERHGAQDRVVALPGPRAVRRAAVEDEIGVEHADAARVHVAAGRLADEREGRPAEQPRVARARRGCRSRGSAPPRGRRRRTRAAAPLRRAVLEHGQDRRVAALHVGRAAADHARALEPRRVALPGRHGVEVPDQRDARRRRSPTRATSALPRRSTATPGSARQRASTRSASAASSPVTLGTATSSSASRARASGSDVNGSAPAGGRHCAPGRRRLRAR